MKQLDKISEAYYGGMGDSFARKTRERIHWICSKVKGTHVLDIGCSQGITEILLAREGKKVIGIDIEEDSINYARNVLKQENDTVKSNVEYRSCSIFDFQSDHLFQTIILAEVLEQFASSAALLDKIKEFLIENGTVIITVPFGINDFIDHKKTYYLIDLLEEIEPYFKINEIKFFGKWLGVVAIKETQEREEIVNRKLVKQLEEAFFNIERQLVDDLHARVNTIKNINNQLMEAQNLGNELRKENQVLENANENLKKQVEQLIQLNESNSSHIEKLSQANEALQEQIKQLKQTNERMGSQIENLEISNGILKSKLDSNVDLKVHEQIKDLEKIIEAKNEDILKRLASEEETLKQYKNAIFEYNKLEAKYANISKKYDLLSKAKLGRLTLKYWKFRNRIPQDF